MFLNESSVVRRGKTTKPKETASGRVGSPNQYGWYFPERKTLNE
jgi:hypothetical protein